MFVVPSSVDGGAIVPGADITLRLRVGTHSPQSELGEDV